MLDKLDKEILKSANGHRTPATISEIIRPFLEQKSDRALRERVKNLEHASLIRLEKHPGCVFVRVTKRGHRVLDDKEA